MEERLLKDFIIVSDQTFYSLVNLTERNSISFEPMHIRVNGTSFIFVGSSQHFWCLYDFTNDKICLVLDRRGDSAYINTEHFNKNTSFLLNRLKYYASIRSLILVNTEFLQEFTKDKFFLVDTTKIVEKIQSDITPDLFENL